MSKDTFQLNNEMEYIKKQITYDFKFNIGIKALFKWNRNSVENIHSWKTKTIVIKNEKLWEEMLVVH